MVGAVEKHLISKIRDDGAILMVLIDPENATPDEASSLAHDSQASGSSAIMIGGTTLVSSTHLDTIVKTIKETVDIPTILFPNNITGVSKHADAMWFMSLLNSSDPYFIAGAQVLAAPLIQKFGLETIPLGYLIVGQGGAAGVIGRACPIPFNKPKLAVAYALAARYMGMRFVYLEAGSGVDKSVPAEMVQMVKKAIGTPLIVGGGMRTAAQAKKIVRAGCDIIVVSTALEGSGSISAQRKVEKIMAGIKVGVSERSEGQGRRIL